MSEHDRILQQSEEDKDKDPRETKDAEIQARSGIYNSENHYFPKDSADIYPMRNFQGNRYVFPVHRKMRELLQALVPESSQTQRCSVLW